MNALLIKNHRGDIIKTISVIGLGYIGLPTAAMLAKSGFNVLGVDLNSERVAQVNAALSTYPEPDLEALLQKVVAMQQLRASTEVAPADVFIIAVPTPFKENHQPDLSYVRTAIENIAPHLKPGNLIILESTSPVGTTDAMAEYLHSLRPDLTLPKHYLDDADVAMAYCPERVLPGQILKELVGNDRVIGGLSLQSAEAAKVIYQTFVEAACFITNAKTAELAKLTENAYRDVNIAFANEMSLIAGELGVDVWELIALTNKHPRVNILEPGPGVGGHCIAVDPWFIVHATPSQANLIRTAREVNCRKTEHVIQEIQACVQKNAIKSMAILGLAYKANCNDLRESPAVDILSTLAESLTCKFKVVEPHIDRLPANLAQYDQIELVNLETALTADLIVLLVKHHAFYDVEKLSQDKRLLKFVQLNDVTPRTDALGQDLQDRPLSEYGLMMIHRVYGHHIT